MKTDLFPSCGHCWVFHICWHIECSTLTASSFRIWNSMCWHTYITGKEAGSGLPWHVWLFVTPWTVAPRIFCPWRFSRQEQWSGLPFRPPGIFPSQGWVKGMLCCSYSWADGNRGQVSCVLAVGPWRLSSLLKTWCGNLSQGGGGRLRDPRILAGSLTLRYMLPRVAPGTWDAVSLVPP